MWLEPFFFAREGAFELGEGSFWREFVSTVRANYTLAGAADGGEAFALVPEDQTDGWLRSCVCAEGGDLVERLQRKTHRKRVLGQLTLTLPNGIELSGCLVSVIRPQPAPAKTKVEAASNKELKTEQKRLCKMHANPLEVADMWRVRARGGPTVVSAVASRQLAERGARLLQSHRATSTAASGCTSSTGRRRILAKRRASSG